MNSRLQQFLDAENINQAQFADSIGVARASVSHILAGRNRPGYDFIANMLKRYPELNIEWLFTGQGKMYKSKTAQKDTRPQPPAGDLFSFSPDIIESDSGPDCSSQPPAKATTAPAHEEHGQKQESPDVRPADRDSNIHEIIRRKAVKIVIFYDDGTFQEFA